MHRPMMDEECNKMCVYSDRAVLGTKAALSYAKWTQRGDRVIAVFLL